MSRDVSATDDPPPADPSAARALVPPAVADPASRAAHAASGFDVAEPSGRGAEEVEVRVHAPLADRVVLVVGEGVEVPMVRSGIDWVGSVEPGTRYGLRADGPTRERFDDRRTLVDPLATEVWFRPGHSRRAAMPDAGPNHHIAPLAVATAWPTPRPSRRTTRPLVVYEAHVRGMTMRRDRPDAGTFRAFADELPRLAALGVSVLELLPVHQYDPDEGNYWGYMPLVFGAVHRQYASGPRPAAELADLVERAHDHDIEIWLDVVFNHTTEEGVDGPTYNLRGLADRSYYAVDGDRSYLDDAGTGNIVDATSPPAQHLVMTALDRFADLGVDGFRFDLASVLSREPAFVRRIGDWAEDRGVRLIAEPWDVVRYEVGRRFPDRRWMQWNDRFRDDVRGFLRGEPGLVDRLMRRIGGSPDLFESPSRSINFVTAHDGFTLYDLVSYDRKHNEANGLDNSDGADENRSWNCGWEGDEGVPDEVMELRRRQLRNAMCLLLLAHGVPMFVAGDEIGRTQGGNNNAFNQDNETSWVDWRRRDDFLDQERFVAEMVALRAAHPILSSDEWWGEQLEWYGVDGPPDRSPHARAVAWHVDGLYAMANMYWEPLTFAVQVPGRWCRVVDTAEPTGVVPAERVGPQVVVEPRSIVVLLSDGRQWDRAGDHAAGSWAPGMGVH